MRGADAATLAFITGREQSLCQPDLDRERGALADAIGGASVLAIGAAGSIGSAFLKELLAFRPRRVVVLDLNENALTELVRDLRSTRDQFIPDDFVTYPIGYSDPIAGRVIDALGPFDLVANFAAHKHVRSEKDMFSIEAMFQNNVFRAQALLERFCEPFCQAPPRHFFCVSTDKASNPANLMGASKKLMEQLLMSYAPQLPVSTARFANVAFSNGSLLDGFLHRLALNQPLSAPNDVRRYFVTPQESGQICLLAGVLGSRSVGGGLGGGPGAILFPKLDLTADTRTFSEIAEAWLANQGLTARRCATEAEAREQAARRGPHDSWYPVYFFGSETSGEKPVEEFHGDDEVVDLARFTSLGVVTGAPVDRAALDRVFDDLKRVFAQRDRYPDPAAHKAALVARLGEVFDGFAHIETGRNLDQKM